MTGQPTAAGSGLDRWVAAVRRADRELFVRTARKHSPVLDRVLPALSGAADNAVLELALAATLAAVGGRRWRRAAARGVAAVAVTSPTANLLAKMTFRRRRPTIDAVPLARRVRRAPITTSFPSGHTASAAAFATAVASAAPELGLPLAGLAAAVGWPVNRRP